MSVTKPDTPAILSRLQGVQRSGKGWVAYCPAHEDRTNRSLSIDHRDGKLLLHCFTGCAVERILAAVDMAAAALFDEPRTGAPGRRRLVATYDYRDEDGLLLYQVVRYEPKDFRPRRPDGKGGWRSGLGEVRRVLYRLPDLVEDERVFWVEGEKDADRLWAVGLPATTSPSGASSFRSDYAQQLANLAIREVIILPDNDQAGRQYAMTVATALQAAGITVRLVELPGLPDRGDVSDWFDAGHPGGALLALADAAASFTPPPENPTPLPGAEGAADLRREGLDLVLGWPDGTCFTLTAIRDGREGVRGELTVTQRGRRLSWGAWSLSSTAARETLRKRLKEEAPGVAWGDYLEEAAFRLTAAAREGEPLVTLTGRRSDPARALIPGLLYDGEPTLLFADGDTGKSLLALTVAVAGQGGTALPNGLTPTRVVTVAYLDWETSLPTIDARLALVAAGLHVAPPPILYKRMTRPLVAEAPALAAEFARRRVGLVVIDSQMFATSSGDGAAFHEPMTEFYGALRLFAPAASLVISHVTNQDARTGAPARPFGGAFAFNGPRLIWEAKRDSSVEDAAALVLTCKKANNLPRRPEPFGLRFDSGENAITVCAFNLGDATPGALASVSHAQRIKTALARDGAQSVEALAESLGIDPDVIRRTLNRARHLFVRLPDTKPAVWALRSVR